MQYTIAMHTQGLAGKEPQIAKLASTDSNPTEHPWDVPDKV